MSRIGDNFHRNPFEKEFAPKSEAEESGANKELPSDRELTTLSEANASQEVQKAAPLEIEEDKLPEEEEVREELEREEGGGETREESSAIDLENIIAHPTTDIESETAFIAGELMKGDGESLFLAADTISAILSSRTD